MRRTRFRMDAFYTSPPGIQLLELFRLFQLSDSL
jgi:hypothetical protein